MVELLAEQINVTHLRALLSGLTDLLDASRLSAQVPPTPTTPSPRYTEVSARAGESEKG